MELANEEVVVDLIRLALALQVCTLVFVQFDFKALIEFPPRFVPETRYRPAQDLALSTDDALPVYNRCAVHALAAAYLNLICQLTTVPAFCQHILEVTLGISVSDRVRPYPGSY